MDAVEGNKEKKRPGRSEHQENCRPMHSLRNYIGKPVEGSSAMKDRFKLSLLSIWLGKGKAMFRLMLVCGIACKHTSRVAQA